MFSTANIKICFCAILCSVVIFASSSQLSAAGNVQILPNLGGELNTVNNILRSDDLKAIGLSDVNTGQKRAVLWQNDGSDYIASSLYTSGDSGAYDSSYNGNTSYIVGYTTNLSVSSTYATVWTSNGGGYTSRTLPNLGKAYGICYGMSEDSQFIVGVSKNSANIERAIVWKNGGDDSFSSLVDLGTIGAEATRSCAKAVSSNGDIIGGYAAGKAAVWLANGSGGYNSATALNSLGGNFSSVYSMNDSGSLLVGESYDSYGNQRAVAWQRNDNGYGDAIDLGTLGGTGSAALRISDDGKIIVGWSQKSDDTAHTATVWYRDAILDVWAAHDLTEVLSRHEIGTNGLMSIEEITGIRRDSNGKYSITGNGNDGTQSIGFAVSDFSVMPEPTTFAMFALCVVMLRRNRKQK